MTTLTDQLSGYKLALDKYLQDFLEEQKTDYAVINSWGTDVIERLQKLLPQGKTLRGSLVLLSHDLYQGSDQQSALIVAAALEMVQASLLIHDDIMDQDELRRGQPTMHTQYQTWGQKHGLQNPALFGTAAAICVGDIGFFLSFQLLNSMSSPFKQRITSLYSQELTQVGLAQMQDVAIGLSDKIPEENEILNVYRYKTGRYSISLPLMVGALLGKNFSEDLVLLEQLGEKLGILFQLKDDQLGLFGDSAKTGKAVGNDIREGKKTLYILKLLSQTSEQESKMIKDLLGNPNLSQENMAQLYELIKKYAVEEKITHLMQNLTQEAKEIIKALSLPDSRKAPLGGFVEYLITRKN